MNIYIAGPYAARIELLKEKGKLESQGHTVTSRWLLGLHDGVDPTICAKDDLEDIDCAQKLVIYLDKGPGTRGGMYVELGYAIARNKEIEIVGSPTNVFTHLFWTEQS